MCKRKMVWLMALVLVIGWTGRMVAEDDSWASDESKDKEIRLTLQSGEVVQGRWSADTKDKVMLSVVTPKGKNMTTVKKVDVKKHEWVKPMEDEVREKLTAFKPAQFEAMQTYAQDVINKGFKKIYLEVMKEKQKELTGPNFKLYVYLLLNNDAEHEAKEVIEWAKAEHPEWKDDIAAAVDRLPRANKLNDPGVTGPAATTTTALAPGMLSCVGKMPSTKEINESWLEDAKKHTLVEASKFEYVGCDPYDQSEPAVLGLRFVATYEAKATGDHTTKYSLLMIYTRRSPNVYAFKEVLITPWATFPHPAVQ